MEQAECNFSLHDCNTLSLKGTVGRAVREQHKESQEGFEVEFAEHLASPPEEEVKQLLVMMTHTL